LDTTVKTILDKIDADYKLSLLEKIQ